MAKAQWIWWLTAVGILCTIASVLRPGGRVLLFVIVAALAMQAIPVWILGRWQARKRRANALEVLEQVGGRITARLASDPRRIVEIDLSRTRCMESEMEAIAGFETLESLDVSWTQVNSEAIKPLARLRWLMHLNLTGTEIDDEAVDDIAALAALQSVTVKSCGMTKNGVDTLRWARPELWVNGLPPAHVSEANAAAAATVG